ncbi:MAG: tetratricopeptide repeat protein [Candidatus Zixiibacteriota bacterium]|nr:MAG: tetratricopeptide repeat protein [candidate division Zixibacteria bacterium]
MGECTDIRFKNMLHSYELDLLSEKDRQEFELHLFECESCRNSIEQFQRTAEHLRHSHRVRALLGRIAGEPVAVPGDLSVRDESKPRHGRVWRNLMPVAVAAVVLVFLLFKPWKIEFQPTQEAIAVENRLIVMYFGNMVDETDSQKLGKIISNLLTADLSESQYIQVVSSQHLHDILRLLERKDIDVFNADFASEVALKAQARWMLQGSIVQIEPRLVLTTQLIDVSTGNVVMSRRVSAGPGDDMFSLVDKLTVEIKNSLSLPEEAYSEFDPAIADVTTHSTKAYQSYLQGVEYFNKLYRREARESYARAVEYDSTFAIAYYCLAWFGDSTMMAKAIKYSDQATRKERLYIKALEAVYEKNRPRYVSYLEEIIKHYPDEKEAIFDLAAHYKNDGQFEKAIEYLKMALEVDPLYKIAYNDLAYVYADLGRFDSSMRAIDKYIELAPDEPNPYDTRGELLARRGYLDEAVESYERVHAIKADFASYGSLFDLGRLYIYKGDYAAAGNCFTEAVINGQCDVRSTARSHLALIPLHQGKLREALEILDNAIAADRMESADTAGSGAGSLKHALKSKIYIELGRLEQALAEIETASEIDARTSPEGRHTYGAVHAMILAKLGNFDEAEQLAEQIRGELAADSTRDSSVYWRMKSRIEFVRGDFESAISRLGKIIDERHANYEDNFILARAYLAVDNASAAIPILEKLITDYTDTENLVDAVGDIKAYYYIGQGYEQAGEIDKAIGQYEKFLIIWEDSDPDIPIKDDAQRRLARLKNRS